MNRACLISLLLLVVLAATCAHANTLAITLSIAFDPPSAQPGDPCFGTTCTLGGTAQFFLTLTGPGIDGTFTNPFAAPIIISGLPAVQSFTTTFQPTDPCFGQNLSCTLGLSFLDGGTTALLPTPPPIFPTTFFAAETDIPGAYPTPPPIIPLGMLGSNLTPNPPPIFQSGPIVAYDAPVVVGTWSVSVTPVPEPSSAILLASGVCALWARRQRHA